MLLPGTDFRLAYEYIKLIILLFSGLYIDSCVDVNVFTLKAV